MSYADATFWYTLLCEIIMQHILLFFDFFSYLHGLLGTARLFISLKNSYLHVYLELKIDCFREILSILFDIWLQLDPLTCLIHFCIQSLQYLTFWFQKNVQNHSISGNFLTCTFIKFWKKILPTRLSGTSGLLN